MNWIITTTLPGIDKLLNTVYAINSALDLEVYDMFFSKNTIIIEKGNKHKS